MKSAAAWKCVSWLLLSELIRRDGYPSALGGSTCKDTRRVTRYVSRTADPGAKRRANCVKHGEHAVVSTALSALAVM